LFHPRKSRGIAGPQVYPERSGPQRSASAPALLDRGRPCPRRVAEPGGRR
jgi:hypothetical protein